MDQTTTSRDPEREGRQGRKGQDPQESLRPLRPLRSNVSLSARTAGLLLVAAGLLVNPRTLGMLFAPDGSLDGEARVRLVILVEVFCIVSGVALLWPRLRGWLLALPGRAVTATAIVALVSLTGVGVW